MGDYEGDYSDEDFETEESESGTSYKASYVIVAVDTHPSMFKIDENGRLPFRNCLEACLRILDSLVLVKDSKRWNRFAVLLTRDDPKFIDFGDNIIASVKMLKSILKLSDDDLENEFQRKFNLDMAEFFLQCKKAFYDIKAAFYKRMLVYITNDDNPVTDAQSKFAAINEVKSFDASQISFQIISTTEQFDYTLLYNEMLALLEQEIKREEICTDVDGLEQKLSSVLIPKYHLRKVRFYPRKDEPNRYITCFDMKFIKSKRLLNIKLTGEGKTVRPKPPPMADELPTFTVKTSGKVKLNVSFDGMEKERLYDFSFPRGYTLIYIGKSVLEPYYNYSQPRLLQAHPTETMNYFRRFWQYCLKKDRVLISVVKHKENASIKFCQMSPISIGGRDTFLCKMIPFADNIKLRREVLPILEPDDEKERLVEQLVDKLTINFNLSMIPNPKYRKKMEYVKAKLLDEPFEDTVALFNRSSLDDRIQEEVDRIKGAFETTTLETNANAKRKRAANPTANARKKKN